jgi:heme exporter protein A
MQLICKDLSLMRGNKPVLKDFEFTVQAGEVIILQGSNGSGKTTLLKTIAGLGATEAGTIHIDNLEVGKEGYQKLVCYLGHKNALDLNLSVRDNLKFWVKIYNSSLAQDIPALLNKLGFSAYGEVLAGELSQGWQKRLALTHLQLHQTAKVWLLDEPFVNLDQANGDWLRKYIEASRKGRIIIVSSHRELGITGAKVVSLGTST